jgi:hormone-sensitive lipase
MAYPALSLNMRNYTPSFIYALDDVILPHTFLKKCLESYIPTDLVHTLDKNFFLSPTLTPKDVIY